jgi:hypothetical protein
MKVYVVSLYDGEKYEVYNVFATREAAEEAGEIMRSPYMPHDPPLIEEFPVLTSVYVNKEV